MKNFAFIPVRGGSKSIPGKNIKNFCGKPLIYWTLCAAQQCSGIDKVFLSTDSKEIEDCARSFGFTKLVCAERDPSTATDTASSESALLDFINRQSFEKKDQIVFIQATNPFLQSEDIGNALEIMSSTDIDSIISCARIKRFFWSEDGTPWNYDVFNRPRRQEFKGALIENGAFYINSVGSILDSGNRLSGKVGTFEMSEESWVELDEPEDWSFAEAIFRKHNSVVSPKRSITHFFTDIDGTLTDAGMYYSENGDELKKFNTHDGFGLALLRERGIKVGIITSEDRELNERRAKKLKADYYFSSAGREKLKIISELCREEGVELSQIAYIGDDMNDLELLSSVGVRACPSSAVKGVKEIPNILKMSKAGGEGAVREFVEYLIAENLLTNS